MVEKLPFDMIERPKMPRATWDALRAHIVRERLRKKEANQEFERQKLAREHKKKQEASTLEDTKEQIQQLENKLVELKKEKHELFNTLKRVLYQDEKERRSKPVPHASIYMQPSVRPNYGGLMYSKHPPHTMMIQQQQQSHLLQTPRAAAVKRPRSPSPPRQVTVNFAPKPEAKELPPTSGWLLPPSASSGSSSAAAVANHYAAAGYALDGNAALNPNFAKAVRGGLLADPVNAAAAAMQQSSGGAPIASITSSAPSRAPPYMSRGQAKAVSTPLPSAHAAGASTISSNVGAPFRPGSIMSGYPRYQPPSTASLSRQSASPRISHSVQPGGTHGSSRFY